MDVLLDEEYRIPTDIRCENPQGQPPTSSGSPSSTQSGSPSSTGTGSSSGTPSPISTGSTSTGGGAISAAVDGLLGLCLASVLAVVLV
jgi:hypothetical protein